MRITRSHLCLFITLCFISFLHADEQTLQPGCLKIIKSKGQSDYRVVRNIAHFNEANTPPSPFMSNGPYQVIFKGQLNIPSRMRLYFSFKGNGKARLKINGELVHEEEGTFTGEESKRIRLNQGKHTFECVYENQNQEKATFKLYWRERKFALEPIPPNFILHDPNTKELKLANSLRKGRQSFADLRCIQCHQSPKSEQSMPELHQDAPSFQNIGERLNPDWVADWMVQPKKHRPKATMPALFGHASLDEALKENDQRAIHIASWLDSLKSDGKQNQTAWSKEDIKQGASIFKHMGCIACHTSPEKTKIDPDRIPLHHLAWKFKEHALKDFIQNPEKHYQWIKMPNFQLSDIESQQLAAFLWTSSKAHRPEKKVIKGDLEKGKAFAQSMGCINCHSGTQLEAKTFKSLAQLPKDWSNKGCLNENEKNHPQYHLSQETKSNLNAFSKTNRLSLNQHHLGEFANRQIKNLNCVACHVYDKTLPSWDNHKIEVAHLHDGVDKTHGLAQDRPQLTYAGEKLKSKWMQQLFKGELQGKPRPWLRAKMPAFKTRANKLAQGMTINHGNDPNEEESLKIDEALEAHGKKLVGAKGFSCIICHPVGKTKAIAAFEVKGLNLNLSQDRLREEFYIRWMMEPGRFVPGTKMLRYSSDGTTAFSEILEGDAHKQYKAIWEFLKNGQKIKDVATE